VAGIGTAAAGRLSFALPELEWATALATPVLMDTAKARGELGWRPRFDAGETLLRTAVAARERGLLE
jgi:nucleoside-diphosphate-sugar epimerase